VVPVGSRLQALSSEHAFGLHLIILHRIVSIAPVRPIFLDN